MKDAPSLDADKPLWLDYLYRLPEDFVSIPQRLQFMLMIEGSWDEFHAPTIVSDLLYNRGLWADAMMITDGKPLWPLPYLHKWWNVDTLYIHATRVAPEQLKTLADGWIGEANWLDEDQKPKPHQLEVGPVLRVWWS